MSRCSRRSRYSLVYDRPENVMKTALIVSFVIYIASSTASTISIGDLRFPIDAKIIQATWNESDIVHLYYELNKNETVIDYQVVDKGGNRVCGINKIVIDEGFKYAKYFHIFPLKKDNILLIPMEYDSKFNEYPVKMELINFSSCQKTDIVLPINNKPTDFRVTRYSDSFDIYYKDLSNPEKSYGRTSYDFAGNVISTPNIEFKPHSGLPLIKPIGSGVRSNKYLAFEFADKKTIVNLVDSEKINVLGETSDTTFIPEVSTSHNLISTVYRVNCDSDENFDIVTNMRIKQFDLDGKLKFETDVKYKNPVRTARILNLSAGGVIIVTSECDRDHCTDEQNIYSIKKFDANGTEVGKFFSRLPSPGIIEDLSLYENKNSYCLTRVQLSLGVSGTWQFKKLDTIYNDFTDNDFA